MIFQYKRNGNNKYKVEIITKVNLFALIFNKLDKAK